MMWMTPGAKLSLEGRAGGQGCPDLWTWREPLEEPLAAEETPVNFPPNGEAHKEHRAKVCDPLSLAFPHREALYKDAQAVEYEPQEEDECEGESTSTLDSESLDETIEAGDRIYATTLCLPLYSGKDSGHMVLDHLYNFEDVFFKASFDPLSEYKQWDYAIELIPDAEPSSCKVYPPVPSPGIVGVGCSDILMGSQWDQLGMWAILGLLWCSGAGQWGEGLRGLREAGEVSKAAEKALELARRLSEFAEEVLELPEVGAIGERSKILADFPGAFIKSFLDAPLSPLTPTDSIFFPEAQSIPSSPTNPLPSLNPTIANMNNDPATQHARMPPCNNTTVPKWDESHPRELPQYFKELEYLFADCSIADDTQKKEYAL
ncbi:hypothetical protein E4T56_gene6950 [Termitomyces sp. T112]|nr:hypothetical protein E4T56_gene6950 [Termitomyces sp. T112]